MLTRVKQNGDIVVEHSSLEQDGFFIVETLKNKLIFPALDQISSSINESIANLTASVIVTELSESVALTINNLSSSVFNKIDNVSSSINGTIGDLSLSLFDLINTNYSSSLLVSSSIDGTIKNVSSSIDLTIKNVSSSLVNTINSNYSSSILVSSSIDSTIKNISSSIDLTIKNVSSSLVNTVTNISNSIPNTAFDGRWDDIQGRFDNATGVSALIFESYKNSGFLTFFFSHNQNDTFCMSFQMSHKWDGTLVKPHLHVVPVAQPGLNVTKNE